MKKAKIVSHDEWMKARKRLLAEEKAFTRARDRLSEKRRKLPWEPSEKDSVFEGPRGKESLCDLFQNRSQLIISHFMFGPEWNAGCPHCSRWADNFNGSIVHLHHRNATMVVVSRAPYAKLAAYKKRMGWSFDWFSSFKTDFNFDFRVSFTAEEMAKKKALYNFKLKDPHASEREGVSVFFKDGRGRLLRTYSTFARGIDNLNSDYHYLDLLPKGRDEGGRGPFWVRRHDEYES
jgi:predicted dithiol-disulfide oxidoreductase (DUF899 family)